MFFNDCRPWDSDDYFVPIFDHDNPRHSRNQLRGTERDFVDQSQSAQVLGSPHDWRFDQVGQSALSG